MDGFVTGSRPCVVSRLSQLPGPTIPMNRCRHASWRAALLQEVSGPNDPDLPMAPDWQPPRGDVSQDISRFNHPI